jgi:hypothetical protein
MLNQTQIMPLLLVACPSFEAVWDSELDAEEKGRIYTCLGTFARHLLELYRQGSVHEFAAVAEVVERLHIEGDHPTREAATIGLLEGIQNVWGNSGVDPELFKPFLLEQTKLWWEQLNLFWSGSIPHVGASMPKKARESK